MSDDQLGRRVDALVEGTTALLTEAQRLKVVEGKVDALKEALDQVLALLQPDPVAASFRRFQQDADRATGRG